MITSFTDIGRFKITMDESWDHEKNRKPEDKIWYEQIPCHGKGFIYLKSDTRCAAYIPSTGVLNNLSNALATARINHHVEHLDGEGFIYFALADLKRAAKVLKAKIRRKPLSEDHKKKLVEAGAAFRFSTGQDGTKQGQISTQADCE